MIQDDLAAEIKAHAPYVAAVKHADLIAKAAFDHWPQGPHWFAWLLVALGSRETHWKNVRGEDGHDCGYLQINDRAWRKWFQDHDAFDPAQNIDKGAEILAWGLVTFNGNARAGIAAYNTGPNNVRRGLALNPPDPDHYTKGGDYGKDVLRRLGKLLPVTP